MSSAEDVESSLAADHSDERLTRAFDRVARLGIDLEPDDGLGEREAAAVRAFAALNLDPGLEDLPPADHAPTSAPEESDDGPLRPDAILHGRPPTRDDTAAGPRPVDVVDDVATRSPVTPPAPSPAPFAPPPPPAATPAPAAPAAPASAAADAPANDTAPHTASDEATSRTIDHYLLDLLALAVATGAFVSPWVWLFVVIVAAMAGAAARSLAVHGAGSRALLRRASRRALSWLRPRSAVWFPVIVARTVLLAVVLPGLVCAAWWIVDEGTDGAFVAGRLGVWAHGPRTAAAIVCFTLVAGVGEAHQRRAALIRRAASHVGRPVVVALAATTILVAALVIAVVPRADAGRLAGADGLAWAPARLQDNIDRVRDDLVAAELHAASGCLSDRQALAWRTSYTAANPNGAPDVAHLSVDGGVPAAADLATAAAAVHNQLAPWVEAVEVTVDGTAVVVLDRGALSSGRPLVDAGALVGAASTGSGTLADGTRGFDRVVALACSAAPIP